jgi:hypothetical protein
MHKRRVFPKGDMAWWMHQEGKAPAPDIAPGVVMPHDDIRRVTIPACDQHGGHELNKVTVYLRWVCPLCGGKRGEIKGGISYDGSRRFHVNTWVNECGHIDYYPDVRTEARANGLNPPLNAKRR